MPDTPPKLRKLFEHCASLDLDPVWLADRTFVALCPACLNRGERNLMTITYNPQPDGRNIDFTSTCDDAPTRREEHDA